MSSYLLTARDEYPHVPTAEPHFNESVYMNAFDPTRRWGGWMRLGNRVNEGYAELAVCLYLPDGRIACQFQRPPIMDNTQFEAGGLRVTIDEPLQQLSMDYQGDLILVDSPALFRNPKALFEHAPRVPGVVHWEQRGISPIYGGLPTTTAQTLFGRDFSLGHFNQHTAVTGHLTLGDEAWPLGGWGWRDHSWGPRLWQNIRFDRFYMANFGADRGLMLLKIANRDGEVRRGGVLFIEGQYEAITDFDIFNEWSPAKDPVSFQLAVRTAARTARIRGQILNCAPLRNRRLEGALLLESRIAECFTELEWDGRQGFGMTEYVELLENGIPAGFPL